MSKPIPLVVIGGFLGAGKTTLLNHWLIDAGQKRFAVLVNDFGPINVDAAMVSAHDGETLSLTNGCICCSIGSGLEDALIRVIDRKPAMDLIVIEASGVSDPGRIAQVGLSDPTLQLEAVVVLVDSEHVIEQLDDPLLGDTLDRQIRAASLLILNKKDLVSPARLAQVRTRIARQFGTLPMIEAEDAMVPVAMLADDASRRRIAAEAEPHSRHEHSHDMPHHPFEGGIWHSDGVLDANELIAALKSLPRTVVRVKGWVTTDRHGPAIVHLAGGRVRVERLPQPRDADGNELVYIGIRDSGVREAVEEALQRLSSHPAGA